MKRYTLMCFLLVFLTACHARDDNYYLSNPKQLQKALEKCQQQSKTASDCAHLQGLANQFQTLANELRFGPQAFGFRIIALETEITKQKEALAKKPDDSQLSDILKKNKEELAARLGVVSVMEAPEG